MQPHHSQPANLESLPHLYVLSEPEQRKVYKDKNGDHVIEEAPTNTLLNESQDTYILTTGSHGLIARLKYYYYKLIVGYAYTHHDIWSFIIGTIMLPTAKIKNNAACLDVGCNTGDLLAQLKERGARVYGVEINKISAQIAQQNGITIYCGDFDSFETEERFDLIIASHLIEHVPDPVAFFNKCASLQNRGGRLSIYTPNVNSFSRFIFGKYWQGYYDKTHLRIMSVSSLKTYASKSGYTAVAAKTYPMALWITSVINYTNSFKLFTVSIGFLRIPVIIATMVSYVCSFPESLLGFGDSIFMEFERTS